jgi:hypothetical protein
VLFVCSKPKVATGEDGTRNRVKGEIALWRTLQRTQSSLVKTGNREQNSLRKEGPIRFEDC